MAQGTAEAAGAGLGARLGRALPTPDEVSRRLAEVFEETHHAHA